MRPRVFCDPALYALEKQHIFGRSWIFLAHDSQIPEPNDFVTGYIGETPVIVARGKNDAIHVNINSCSHRGLAVCRHDRGNARSFVCPYHNWAFSNEGKLIAVPQERKVRNRPDKSKLGLKAVPRVESYDGLIFGCMDPEVEPLEDFLGDMKFYLDCMFDRFEGGVELLGAPHRWQIDCNWKLPVENQLGDVGHGPFLHGSLLAGTPQVAELEKYAVNVVPKPGHGVSVRLMPEGTDDEQCMYGTDGLAAFDPEVRQYLLDAHKRVADRLGEVRARLRPLCYSVYPNLSFLWPNGTLRISHPRGPGRSEYWSWWVVEKNAPDFVKKALQGNYTNFFGPGGLLEQEDSEAWMQQYTGASIDYADDHRFYYGLGFEEEEDHEEIPGRVGSCFNEHYARAYYQRWQRELASGEEGR
ncbi:MAG: Rieske 2Fe-2S domain-containing protein [Deltaproteobacteria bacterium]|nr:Rieske 2Fe-2S domain-containing protein [Deltaproteobacteria bacterium]